MKTIGLLGGMSWESTIGYYQQINQSVKAALGGLHSAQIILKSVDFDPIEKLQHQGDWEGTAKILAEAAVKTEKAGADFLLICTNTMHKVAPQIEQAISIPLLHIADVTGKHLQDDGIDKVGLLGTAFTMEQDFYRGRLTEKYQLDVIIPEQNDRTIVHQVIYNELCQGIISEDSKQEYLRIIDQLQQSGAEAVILGCTEIGLLVSQQDCQIPLYDTTQLHAFSAAERALSKN